MLPSGAVSAERDQATQPNKSRCQGYRSGEKSGRPLCELLLLAFRLLHCHVATTFRFFFHLIHVNEEWSASLYPSHLLQLLLIKNSLSRKKMDSQCPSSFFSFPWWLFIAKNFKSRLLLLFCDTFLACWIDAVKFVFLEFSTYLSTTFSHHRSSYLLLLFSKTPYCDEADCNPSALFRLHVPSVHMCQLTAGI